MRRNLKLPSGFTLVELLVVLLIVGILMAIGIFGWGALKARANATEAEATADRVFNIQATTARDWGRYTPYGKDLVQAGPELSFKENGSISTGPTDVSIVVGRKGTLGVAILDASGSCHFWSYSSILQNGTKTEITNKPASAPCSGREALPNNEPPGVYTPGGSIKQIS